MTDWNSLKEKNDATTKKIVDSIDDLYNIQYDMQQVANEARRVAQIAKYSDKIIDELNKDFESSTKLKKVDISFLLLATGLQVARQYFLSNDKFRINSNQGDKLMGNALSLAPPDWKNVLTQSVPYDAIKTGVHVSNTGISGTTHRYRTLGHDPVLGWVFGTANIMTGSLTKTNFETYQVKNMTMVRHYPMGVAGMLDRAVSYSINDPKLLAVSVGRQAIHFGSDYFTKQGLPIPFVATINNELAQKMLTEWHIDMWSITRGAVVSAFINQLVATIHRLFCDSTNPNEQKLYEVRTRKILSYSNVIASASNVIAVAIGSTIGVTSGNPAVVRKSMNYLDIGGLMVTIYRIISDRNFIYEIKKEFLSSEFERLVMGN